MANRREVLKKIDLTGDTVIITGSTGGLGFELAEQYIKAGSNLILIAKDNKKLERQIDYLNGIKKNNQFINQLVIDFSCEDFELSLKDKLNNLPKIDALINNAAVHGPIGQFYENSLEEWERAFRINFYAPMKIIHSLLPSMIENKKGKIINISGGGAAGCRPGYSSYSVAKTGLVKLTETLSHELIGSNIQINIVAPGMMPTQLLNEVIESEISSKREIEMAKSTFTSNDPYEDIKSLCLFLSSNLSNDISGKFISAKWDQWEDLNKINEVVDNDNLYTLRRVTK
ncbi:SDR family oxidoreductase [Verrucomicrobiales bacterium]|nr:SDR family oxidoreductase [Verrucomicrobiales bacterium]